MKLGLVWRIVVHENSSTLHCKIKRGWVWGGGLPPPQEINTITTINTINTVNTVSSGSA